MNESDELIKGLLQMVSDPKVLEVPQIREYLMFIHGCITGFLCGVRLERAGDLPREPADNAPLMGLPLKGLISLSAQKLSDLEALGGDEVREVLLGLFKEMISLGFVQIMIEETVDGPEQ